MHMKCGHRALAWGILMVVLLLVACGKSNTIAWQEQYDLGMQYLTEGDYGAAIVAFTAAIEIEPKRASIYIARGDAYIVWAEETEMIVLAAVLKGNFVAWEDISTEDGSYTLQELYDNAQSDYEDAIELLENGEAEDQSDDLLEEARQKLEEARTKQEDGKDDLARELIELAEKILEGDSTEEEKELAYELLEEAKELTEDEELLNQIAELLQKEDLSGEEDEATLEDEVINNNSSEDYLELGSLSEEKQALLISLVEDIQSGQLDDLTDPTEWIDIEGKYLLDDDTKVSVIIEEDYIYYQHIVPYMIVAIRPENGTGYCYYVWGDGEETVELQKGELAVYIIDYVICPCVDWNWEGEYTEEYSIFSKVLVELGDGSFGLSDEIYTWSATCTGTVTDNKKDGIVNVVYDSGYSFILMYNDGVEVQQEDGPQESDIFSYSYTGVDGNYWLNIDKIDMYIWFN